MAAWCRLPSPRCSFCRAARPPSAASLSRPSSRQARGAGFRLFRLLAYRRLRVARTLVLCSRDPLGCVCRRRAKCALHRDHARPEAAAAAKRGSSCTPRSGRNQVLYPAAEQNSVTPALGIFTITVNVISLGPYKCAGPCVLPQENACEASHGLLSPKPVTICILLLPNRTCSLVGMQVCAAAADRGRSGGAGRASLPQRQPGRGGSAAVRAARRGQCSRGRRRRPRAPSPARSWRRRGGESSQFRAAAQQRQHAGRCVRRRREAVRRRHRADGAHGAGWQLAITSHGAEVRKGCVVGSGSGLRITVHVMGSVEG